MLGETVLVAVNDKGKVVYAQHEPVLVITNDKHSLVDGKTIHTIKKLYPETVRVLFDIAI